MWLVYIYIYFSHVTQNVCERILRIQISTDSYRKVDWLYI